MAIGTLAAVGLGVAGVGSFLGGKSANKASKRAAQVSADNNAQNAALQREIYGQNKAILNPYVQRGNVAGEAINALLGLGGTTSGGQTQPNALYSPYSGAGADSTGYRGFPARRDYFNREVSGPIYNYASAQNPLGGTPVSGGVTSQQAAENAFSNFRNSTGYQFRLGQGMDALNSGYAGAGVLQSGDAIKSALEYGQNFASGEFGNYLGYLGNQQGVGLSGASAIAGVGQNYANNVTAGNTENAANQAAAYLSRQNPFANTLGAIGGGLFNYGTGRI